MSVMTAERIGLGTRCAGGQIQEVTSCQGVDLMIRARKYLCALAATFLTAFTVPEARSQATPVQSGHRWSMDELADAVPTFARSAKLTDKLVLWYVQDGRIHIGVTSTSASMLSSFRARFGTDAVIFRHPRIVSASLITVAPKSFQMVRRSVRPHRPAPGVRPAATATAPTRLQDGQPYFGGDRIVRTYSQGSNNYIVQCTVSSPMLTSANNSQAMLTAGHCGPTGTVWDQGYYPGTGGIIYITGTMGTDSLTQWGNNRVDGELLQGATYGYDPYVYVSATASDMVDGSALTGTGSIFCTDGSFTGYSCGAKVTHENVCANVIEGAAAYNVCHLDIADANHRIVQSGDSGGPVLYPEPLRPGHVTLAGTISAQSNNGNEVFFSDIQYLQSGLNAYVW